MLLNKFSNPVKKDSLSNCNSCQSNKSHRQSFSTSSLLSHRPLQIIYIDLWSPSPVFSIDRKRYYILFVGSIFKILVDPHDSIQTWGLRCFQNSTSFARTSISNKNIIFLYQQRRRILKFNFLFKITGHWTINFPTLYATKNCCSWKTTSPCCRNCKDSNASSLFTNNLLEFYMSSSCFSHKRNNNPKFKKTICPYEILFRE